MFPPIGEGLAQAPWGILRVEPIGSSNDSPRAEVASPPEMRQLSLASLVQRVVARLAVTEGLFSDFPRVQPLSQLC